MLLALQDVPIPAIPERITDQGLLLVAFMLLIGLAVAALVFFKGPAIIAAWRAGASGSANLLEQLDRIEEDVKVLRKALIVPNDEGHPTAVSRRLAADIAGALSRIEKLVKDALRRRA